MSYPAFQQQPMMTMNQAPLFDTFEMMPTTGTMVDPSVLQYDAASFNQHYANNQFNNNYHVDHQEMDLFAFDSQAAAAEMTVFDDADHSDSAIDSPSFCDPRALAMHDHNNNNNSTSSSHPSHHHATATTTHQNSASNMSPSMFYSTNNMSAPQLPTTSSTTVPPSPSPTPPIPQMSHAKRTFEDLEPPTSDPLFNAKKTRTSEFDLYSCMEHPTALAGTGLAPSYGSLQTSLRSPPISPINNYEDDDEEYYQQVSQFQQHDHQATTDEVNHHSTTNHPHHTQFAYTLEDRLQDEEPEKDQEEEDQEEVEDKEAEKQPEAVKPVPFKKPQQEPESEVEQEAQEEADEETGDVNTDSAESSDDSDEALAATKSSKAKAKTGKAKGGKGSRGRKAQAEADAGGKDKMFSCDVCKRKFRRQEHLKRHHRSLHTQEKPFECDKCGKKFSRSDNLAQHARTHARHGGSSDDSDGSLSPSPILQPPTPAVSRRGRKAAN